MRLKGRGPVRTCAPEWTHWLSDRIFNAMKLDDISCLPEEPAHDAEIEIINAEAFGPGRYARAAYRIREGGPHLRALSFVAVHEGAVVGSVRMTPIAAGAGRGLLLGPLAVRPDYKNMGIGRKLVHIALDAAAKAGCGVVVLVGDAPYYEPLGFRKIPPGQVSMPRPVDPERLLACEITPGALALFCGVIDHADSAPVCAQRL